MSFRKTLAKGIALGLGLLLLAAVLAVTLAVQPVVLAPKKAPVPAVSAAVLESYVRSLVENFYPRSFDYRENLDAAAVYIEEKFRASGARVRIERFQAEEGWYSNILAEFGPENGPVIVVGAHYDSFALADSAVPEHTPGADDNASGVAGLLALADVLHETGDLPTRVMLAAYSLEEPPFFATERMGSAVHANGLRRTGTEVKAMIALEMIGCFSDATGSQSYPLEILGSVYPDRGNFIGVVGRFQDISLTRRVKKAMMSANELPVWSISALPLLPGLDFSDHRNFWRAGFPAVMVTDTAFYRNRNYHRLSDTPDTLDYERMAMVVQGVFHAVHSLAVE